MAKVSLSKRDVDLIARVVDTEVPRSIAGRASGTYDSMVRAVVDTVMNRVASPDFPNTVEGVLNQDRAFSKITGPSRLDPYGSVQKTPEAPASVLGIVQDHVTARAQGAPSTIGQATHYANPNFSDQRNLLGWINPMIEAGAQKLGIGNAVHVHGTPPGQNPAPQFEVAYEGSGGGSPQGLLASLFNTPGASAAPMPATRPQAYSGDSILANSGQFSPMATDNTGGAVLRAMPTTGGTVAASSDPMSQFEFTPNMTPVAPVSQDMGMGLSVMPMPGQSTVQNTSLMDPAFGAPVPPITMGGVDQMTTVAQDAMNGTPALDPTQPLDYPGIPVPAQKPLAPLPPPVPVKQYNVARPSAPASPPPPPMPSGMDVWQGTSSYGMATDGSTLSRNPDGSVSRYSAKYDRWDTMNPQTGQWLPGGAPSGGINLPSRDRIVQQGKSMGASAAGGLLGSALLGPVGGLLGAVVARNMIEGKGILGNQGTMTQPMNRSAPQNTYDQLAVEARRSALQTNGGSFQSGSQNPSDYSYSPAAHDMANAGMGGLF